MDCAEVLAEKHQVSGYDIYPRHSSKIKITDQDTVINDSDWIFIAVPTPHAPGYDGSVPSSHLEPRDFGHEAVHAVLQSVNSLARSAKKIVLISTVLPGTTRREFATVLDSKHTLLYNPYLIAMGSVKWDMVNPEMIIIGTEDGLWSGAAGELRDLYQTVMQNNPRYELGTWDECEAIKIFYNTFISAKVGLVNMIQDFAMQIGHINVDVVTQALANSTMRIMGPKYMTAGMGDAGACHPRDNIALRWLAKHYDIGYDLFDTIMQARELQARNMAKYLISTAQEHSINSIVIHGKAYKPDVPYCIGSYSTLIAHYVKELGHSVKFLDPLADDPEDVVNRLTEPCVLLMAHNRQITYGYTGQEHQDLFYSEILPGSVIVDPWRRMPQTSGFVVRHYGNTRHF